MAFWLNHRAFRVSMLLGAVVLLAAAALAPAYQPNWRADYFTNTKLKGKSRGGGLHTAIDSRRMWPEGGPQICVKDCDSPGAGKCDGCEGGGVYRTLKKNFSVRWTARKVYLDEGRYEFWANVDNGIRVWVDRTPVIDDWRSARERQIVTPRIYLPAGYYDLTVEYFHKSGPATINFGYNWE